MATITAKRKPRFVADANGFPIQALSPDKTVTIAYTDTAGVNSSSPIVAEIVRLHATTACYVKFGDVDSLAATTADMYLEANKPELFALSGHQYISAIRAGSSGNLFVTLMI